MGRIYQTAIKIGATVARSLRTDTLAGAEALKKLGAEAKKLDATAKAAAKLDELGTAANAARTKFNEAAAAEKKLAEEAKSAGKPTDELKQKLTEAKSATRVAAQELKAAERATAKLGAGLRAAGVDTEKLADEQYRLASEAARSARALAAVEASEKARTRLFGKRKEEASLVDQLSARTGKLRDRAASLARDGMLAMGGAAAAAAVPLQRYTQFQRGMAEAATLVEDKAKLPELARRVRALSVEYGSPHVQTASALWTTLSAGIQDTAKATEVLTVAQRFAVGGSFEVKDATIGLASSVNAYKEANLTAADAADILFTASAIGQAAPEALAKTIGHVTPLASAAGVTFDQLAAGIGALTTVIPDTAEAVTGMRGILTATLDPSKEASKEAKRLGIEFSASALKAKGLSGFIRDLAKNEKFNAESASKLFGRVEAANAVMLLAKNGAATFNDALSQMERRGGAVDKAFGTMSATLDFQWKRAKAQADDVLITIGERLAPAANRALSRVSAYVTANGDKIQAWADKIGAWVDAKAIPAFEQFVPRVVALVSGVAAGVEKLAGWVGGWENFGKLLVALRFAPLIASIASVGSALARTTIALGGYILKLYAARAAQEALASSGGAAGGAAAAAGGGLLAAGRAKLAAAAGAIPLIGAKLTTGVGALAGSAGGAAAIGGGVLAAGGGGYLLGRGIDEALGISDWIGRFGNREKSAGTIEDLRMLTLERQYAAERAQIALPSLAPPRAGAAPSAPASMTFNFAGVMSREELDAQMARARAEALAEFDRREADRRRRGFQ